MSITNPDKIDAAAADGNDLVLLLTDHLRWDKHKTAHLQMLQDKLNTYIRYIDQKLYQEAFPDRMFSRFVIQIDFLHPYDEGFTKMVTLVKPQLDQRSITIRCQVQPS